MFCQLLFFKNSFSLMLSSKLCSESPFLCVSGNLLQPTSYKLDSFVVLGSKYISRDTQTLRFYSFIQPYSIGNLIKDIKFKPIAFKKEFTFTLLLDIDQKNLLGLFFLRFWPILIPSLKHTWEKKLLSW